MHIGDLQKIDWIRQRVEDPNFIPSDKNKLLKAMLAALTPPKPSRFVLSAELCYSNLSCSVCIQFRHFAPSAIAFVCRDVPRCFDLLSLPFAAAAAAAVAAVAAAVLVMCIYIYIYIYIYT